MTADDAARRIRLDMIRALSGSPLLQCLVQPGPHAAAVRDLLERAEIRTFRPREVVIEQGVESDLLYLLIEGAVEVIKEGRVIARLDKPGDVFGEIGAITGQLRTATVRAARKVQCLAADARIARRLEAEGNTALQHLLTEALNTILAGRLAAANDETAALRKEIDAARAEIDRLKTNARKRPGRP